LDRALRPCKHSGCPNLTRDPSGYCEDHIEEYRQRDHYRGNSRQRGYDNQWERFRLSYLRRHPLCADCEKQGKYIPATEIHHIRKLRDYPALKYEKSNLMGLCHECHSRRTIKGE
jgi:5-methylcytosine-specific restriction protein A